MVKAKDCGSGMVQPLARLGVSGIGLRASAAFIAPHSEWPHTTMLRTFKTRIAYSIALASAKSPVEGALHGRRWN